MKKFLKGVVAMFAFVLTFFVVGVSKVDAREPSLRNTTISGSDMITINSSTEQYYVSKDGIINLKLKSEGYNAHGIVYVPYYSQVSIAKCVKQSEGTCLSWSIYDYNPENLKEVKPNASTADNLNPRFGNGLTLNLRDVMDNYASQGAFYANDVALTTLTSDLGIDTTYFVIVRYKDGIDNKFLWSQVGGKEYEQEIYKIALREELQEIKFERVTVVGNVTKVLITSGVPFSNVRYFATSTKIEGAYDYNTKFTDNNGVVALAEAEKYPLSINGVFAYELTITTEEGKNYYIEANDVSGKTFRYDLTDQVATDNTEKGDSNPLPGDNVADEDIGKIILIALLVLLVISIALVIIQKIVDHRRKLY